jgi:hypothetical protein
LFMLLDAAAILMYVYSVVVFEKTQQRVAWLRANKWWIIGLVGASLVLKAAHSYVANGWKVSKMLTTVDHDKAGLKVVEVPVLPISAITSGAIVASLFNKDDSFADSLAATAVLINTILLVAGVVKSSSVAYAK